MVRDLENARAMGGFTEIVVTFRAVEETASLISSILNDRFPSMDRDEVLRWSFRPT